MHSFAIQWRSAIHRAAVLRRDLPKLSNRCTTASALPPQHATDVEANIAAAQKAANERPPRFYVPPPLPASVGSTLLLDGQEGGHAVRVLRLRAGDQVQLCDGAGRLLMCRIVSTDKSSALVEAEQAAEEVAWEGPQWQLAVACTTLKGGRTDWLVEKATELGARCLLPVVTERSQPTPRNKFKKAAKKAPSVPGGWADEAEGSRLERLAVAASKQCLRAHMLRVEAPLDVAALVELVGSCRVALVAAAGGAPLVEALQGMFRSGQATRRAQEPRLLIVGPEGDFTPEELAALLQAGAVPVGLGTNRLRTETAALSLLATASLVDASAEHSAAM